MNEAESDVFDDGYEARVAGSRPVFGDHLETLFAVTVVLDRIAAGTLDLPRPDQVQKFRKFVLIAVVGIPARDVEVVRSVDTADLHLGLDLVSAVFGESAFDHREVSDCEVRERRAGTAEMICAEACADAFHMWSPHDVDCEKWAGTYVLSVASAIPKPWRVSMSIWASDGTLRSVGCRCADSPRSSRRKPP
jgi:hypothetical protein